MDSINRVVSFSAIPVSLNELDYTDCYLKADEAITLGESIMNLAKTYPYVKIRVKFVGPPRKEENHHAWR